MEHRATTLWLYFAATLAAVVASAVVLLIAGMLDTRAGWTHESLLAFLAAAAWMAIGTGVAGYNARFATTLFCTGAFAAWFLARGAFAPTSPWTGLIQIFSACAGGSTAWAFRARQSKRWWLRAPFVPAVVAVAVGIHAMSTSTPGLPDVIRRDGRINESVPNRCAGAHAR